LWDIATQPFQSPPGSRLDSRDGIVSQLRHGIDIAVDQSLGNHLQRHLTGPPVAVFKRVDHCRRRGLVPGVQHCPKRPGPYEVSLGAESEFDPPTALTAADERHQLRLVDPVHLSIKMYTAVHQPARPPTFDGQRNQHGRMGVEGQVEVVCHNLIIPWLSTQRARRARELPAGWNTQGLTSATRSTRLETGSVRIGGIVGRAPHPARPD
jgi:hypothetical protein